MNLRVHTDETGQVWCGLERVCAMPTGMPPRVFTDSDMFRGASCVRVAGSRINAPLIAAMYEAGPRNSPRSPSVLIGSPAMLTAGAGCPSVERCLRRLWQTDSSLRGSWHAMSPLDFTAYRLIATVDAEQGRIGPEAELLFRDHPVWPVVSFQSRLRGDRVVSCDTSAAIHLACEIVDPRWYTDPARPNRCQRLFRYLGIEPCVLRGVVGNAEAEGRLSVLYERASMVLRACGEWPVELRGDVGSCLKRARDFLRLTRWVWLQEAAGSACQLFDPGMHFKRADEAEAFKRHLETASSKRCGERKAGSPCGN